MRENGQDNKANVRLLKTIACEGQKSGNKKKLGLCKAELMSEIQDAIGPLSCERS